MNILLLDTNLSSLPIYKFLKNIGYNVYVIGTNERDTLALLCENNYIKEDYSDFNKTIEIVKEFKIDLVLPGCNDVSFNISSRFNELNNRYLKIDSSYIINLINNKSQFKRFAKSFNIKVPKGINFEELKQVPNNKFIIKPVDSFSGKGVTVLEGVDSRNINEAIELAKSNSKGSDYIIEEFVEGTLYSHSAFVKNKKIYIDFIVEEHCESNPYAVDNSWLIDIDSFEYIDQIRIEIQKVVDALDLCDGLIHTQFIKGGSDFWILEITRRCPGDLYSLLIEYSTGFNYAGEYISLILGLETKTENFKLFKKPILRKTLSSPKKHEWLSLTIDEDIHKLVEFYPLEKAGTILRTAPKDRGGILFLKINK